MKVHKKLIRGLSGLLAVLALVCAAQFTADATPPSGIAFTPVGRATVPEFDVRRRFRIPSEDGEQKGKAWKLELEATQPIDVATQIVTFQPGGFSDSMGPPAMVRLTPMVPRGKPSPRTALRGECTTGIESDR
jgi:hypothetical protein